MPFRAKRDLISHSLVSSSVLHGALLAHEMGDRHLPCQMALVEGEGSRQ